MMTWLKRHGWVQESDSGLSEAVSFVAFLVMPGCLFAAIIHRLMVRD